MNVNFPVSKWSVFCNLPFMITIDTRLRWFQFRLVHRILGVNSFLAKIGRRDDNLCTFCHAESETLVHLFCTCEITLTFWTQLSEWMKKVLNINVYLDNEVFLFGILNKNWSALNLILLLCRFHIYKMKMKDSKPSIVLLKNDIKQYYALEKFIFITNGDTVKFNLKWDPFSLLCKE